MGLNSRPNLRLNARRTALRLGFGLFCLTALVAGFDALSWWRAQRINAQISDPSTTPGADVAADAAPELRFAQAHALAASGAAEAALNRYGALQGDSPLGQAARFNSANLLLRQGMALHSREQPGQALALIELAKESYREILRHEPDDWPARYNLERAQRLVPDPEEVDDTVPDVNRSAERAATTMRGYSPGLP